MDELEALLSLEDLASDPARVDESQGISGRIGPAIVAAARVGASPAALVPGNFRSSIAAACLPRLAEGETVKALALELGVCADTLASWLVAHDDEAYRKALAAQVAHRLVGFASEGQRAMEDAARAVRLIDERVMVVTEDGAKSTKQIMVGPELAKAARVRSQVALDGARQWQWLGERRRPDLFRTDGGATGTGGGVRASFTFVLPSAIELQAIRDRAQASAGRVIEGEAIPAGRLSPSAIEPAALDR